MSPFAFPHAIPASVAIANSDARFPLHRIYCVGRNYEDHVREMGGTEVNKGTPIFFSKPADAVVESGAALAYPLATSNLHHEIELVIALKSGGSQIALKDAAAHIFGYAVGCDLTRRDLQALAKSAGAPWDLAKGFDQSAPISAIFESAHVPQQGRIWLSVNQALKQDANLSQMIWSISEIISALSDFFELKAGDLIFTGTPAGVGPLQRADQVSAGIEGIGELHFSIAN